MRSNPSVTAPRVVRLVRGCVALFALLAVVSYGFSAFDLVKALLEPGIARTVVDRDFVNYWLASVLYLNGDPMLLFHHDSYFAVFEQVFGQGFQIRSWSYPPHFLLMIWPLGLLGYELALVVFFVVTFALFATATIVFRNRVAPYSDPTVLLLATVGYTLMMLVAGQNGFLTAAAMLFGLAEMKRRPTIAGFAFACLTIKPQLGLLIPVLLVLDRNWRTLTWATVFTAVFAAISVAMLGGASWTAYFGDTVPYQRYVMTGWDGIFLRMMPTVFGSVRSLELSPTAAIYAQLPVSLAAVLLVSWFLLREREPLRRAFAVVCGTFLVTPYAFNYDMGALCVCGALLAGAHRENGHWLIAVAVAATAGGAVTNLGRAHLPVTPIILIAALVALAFFARPINALATSKIPLPAPR